MQGIGHSVRSAVSHCPRSWCNLIYLGSLPEALLSCESCLQGNVVTNFHVLGSVLKSLGRGAAEASGRSGPAIKVARVALLGHSSNFLHTRDILTSAWMFATPVTLYGMHHEPTWSGVS